MLLKTGGTSNVEFDQLFDPRGGIKIDITELTKLHPSIWNAQGSGKKIPLDVATELSALWLERTGVSNSHFPEEIEDNESHFEGTKKTIVVNRYERDPEVRRKCIARWGTSCFVCKFHFEYFYGPLGRDYIHVHHLKPLGEVGGEYQVDPINDLRPVCPNCHSMLHRQNPAISIQQLQDIISLYGKRLP